MAATPPAWPAPCPAAFNFAAHVLAGGGADPARPALEVWGAEGRVALWARAGLRAAARQAAGAMLAAIGGQALGRVVFLGFGNDVETPIHFLGAGLAGLIPLCLSPELAPAERAELRARLRPVLALDDPAAARCTRLAARPLARAVASRADDPAYLALTSGTSGRMQPVLHAHRAVWTRRSMWDGWYGLGPGDRLMHAGAFNWTYTLGTGLFDPLAAGATAIIPAAGTPHDALGTIVARSGATLFAAAPAVYRRLLRASPALDAPALRHGLSAGAKMPERMIADWQAATGRPVFEAYGLSECSTFVSACPPRPAPPGAIGWPQPGRKVALLDEGGRPVAPGMPGEMAIHRSDPGLALGYLGDEAAFAARMSGEWFRSGDLLCAQPEDGALRYLGRSDDMMNAGGVRVSPAEVEEAALGFPGIAEAAAVAVEVRPDVEVIGLAYVTDRPSGVDEAALNAYLETRLARYKRPRLVARLPALPRNANGKLLRRELKKAFAR